MVRVLFPPKMKQVECARCNAVLEYSYPDTKIQTVQTVKSSKGTGNVRHGAFRYIDCPVCEKKIKVTQEERIND